MEARAGVWKAVGGTKEEVREGRRESRLRRERQPKWKRVDKRGDKRAPVEGARVQQHQRMSQSEREARGETDKGWRGGGRIVEIRKGRRKCRKEERQSEGNLVRPEIKSTKGDQRSYEN